MSNKPMDRRDFFRNVSAGSLGAMLTGAFADLIAIPFHGATRDAASAAVQARMAELGNPFRTRINITRPHRARDDR